jgi:predicted nucleic acid-binding Zn finger protein
MDVRKHVRALLQGSDTACLGAALMLMPPSLVQKAVAIADQQDSIKRVFEHISVFSVKGSTGQDYLVVPYKYCSCRYYCENVMKQRLSWTCKHDLAVLLRLKVGGPLKIHPAATELLAKQLIYVK